MKKFLLPVILILNGLVSAQNINSLDPSQIYSTGNLVNNQTSSTNTTGTWQNIGLWNQGLPCWGPGGPVYCGPNPYFNQGSLNFSYGITDVYQVVSIANTLPNSGTGLRINGYNFGFLAKNGNGWDNGQTDHLSAYVNFHGADGKIVKSDYYNLNYKFDWWQFNYSKTFDTPLSSNDLSTVRYGFVGGDSNFWAGPYGPEITNISFSLKYSVDPCFVNVLSSPSCPGYLDALNKYLPVVSIEPVNLSTTSTSPVTSTTIAIEPANVTVTTTSNIAQPIATIISSNLQNTSNTSNQSTSQSNKETVNNNLALSIISKNQERDSATLSIAQNAVSQANQVAQQSQQESLNIVTTTVENSQNANIVSIGSQQFTGTGIRINSSSVSSSTVASSSSIQTNTFSTSMQIPQPSITNVPINVTSTLEQQQQTQSITANVNSLNAGTADHSNVPINFLTDRANPLNEIVGGGQINILNNSNQTVSTTVNNTVSDNEIAGGVSINRMAVVPVGYGDYLNLTLRDVSFYTPKEIYKNQRNVDNIRLLRQLTNDSKHNEMVEQQYRR